MAEINSETGKRSAVEQLVMPYDEEKNEGRKCANFTCQFYDETGTYEQGCCAGDEDDNIYLPDCDKYIPEHDGA